ncbi:RNA polymerase sigma factor [Micromonospora sp. NPDC051141]|uniref:RNA polymerase sigma factor n=1 Tax=Micromonospora sp. NPDC051141 TaxID=3364284 RepID=UPI003798B4DE
MRATHDETPSLAQRFHNGEETALAEMYRCYSGAMFATALNLLGNRDLAAEAVQQAFVQAWRAADRFDPSRELRPWLYAITRRAAVDVHRRQRRTSHDVSVDDSWSVEGEIATEGPSIDTMWQVWQVREALDQLPADERLVLQLAYYQQMTQSEVADALGIPLGTVKSRTYRAQRNLAVRLAHLRETSGGRV